jgi:hypothetical protein
VKFHLKTWPVFSGLTLALALVAGCSNEEAAPEATNPPVTTETKPAEATAPAPATTPATPAPTATEPATKEAAPPPAVEAPAPEKKDENKPEEKEKE